MIRFLQFSADDFRKLITQTKSIADTEAVKKLELLLEFLFIRESLLEMSKEEIVEPKMRRINERVIGKDIFI